MGSGDAYAGVDVIHPSASAITQVTRKTTRPTPNDMAAKLIALLRVSALLSRPMKSVLAIAGSDPTGGAGLQADLQVIRHLGCHGMGVISALTVQDTQKVHSVLPVFPSVILDQLRCLIQDAPPDAVKIGMLASDDIVRNTTVGLASLPEGVPVVLDPILFASDGSYLLERRAYAALMDLFALTTLVTPNLPEIETLLEQDVSGKRASESAARRFVEEFNCPAVLLKGGHRDGAPDDLLAMRRGDEIELHWFEGERIETEARGVHGTGCALSSAIAVGLAEGLDLVEAITRARAFVAGGLANAHAVGRGAQVLGFTPGR